LTQYTIVTNRRTDTARQQIPRYGSYDECRTAPSGCWILIFQTKPTDLGRESAHRLLSSTSTTTI